MKNIKLSFALLATLPIFLSCTSENSVNSSSEYVNSVRVNVEDFILEGPTSRTAYTVDDNGFHFSWADGDALGIYPIGGDQVKFPISNGDGSASATFDGGSWKLRSTYQYAAYYPFSTDNYTIAQTALPVSYTGQTQDGNASTAHLGAYDYLACAATTPDANGGVDLTMKHLGAFIRLQLTMPKADTYSSVEIKSDGTPFVTAGTFDLTAETPAITSTTTSDTYTINLTNVSTTSKGEVITVYAMVAPADLSTSNIIVTVHGTGSTTYVQTVTGKNFEARYGYNIAVTSFPSGTNASGEDVSWVEPTTGTAKRTGNIDVQWVQLWDNGPKWAVYNVGATSISEYGGYYCWGSSIDQDANRSFYNSSDNIQGSSYDTATNIWGSNWQMPTYSDYENLIANCDITWITYDGTTVKGRLFTGKGSYSGNSVFFPASGYTKTSSNNIFISGKNSYGEYWSATYLTTDIDSNNMYGFLQFTSSQKGSALSDFGSQGYSVRAILK